MASLIVIQGRNRGDRLDVADSDVSLSIGRDSSNTIRVDDNEVSRRHAEIRRTGDQFVISDLQSSNGTYVNSRKVERAQLTSGDHIQIGRTTLVFAQELADIPVGQVDIVSGPAADDHSRIVSSFPDETADLLAAAEDTQSLRLARARSNVQVMYRTALAISHTLDIDDLLGRDAVAPNHLLLAKRVTGRTVLVTGAGGSIGGELCRQVLALNPTLLLLLDASEFALYTIHAELESLRARFGVGASVRIIPLLCSVQNEDRVWEIMSTWRPNTVYHAAAYKHVPLVEHN
ncbi:FHA domain-containing protein, partial [bacterium]|nr:FHA domain-containing protein [bacterium]